MAVKNTIVRWVLNSRVRVLLKGAVINAVNEICLNLRELLIYNTSLYDDFCSPDGGIYRASLIHVFLSAGRTG